MLGFNRWHLLKGLAAILCIAGIVSLALIYFIPAPPSKIKIAGSFQGSYYNVVTARYKEILARAHVTVDARLTDGAIDNLRLLKDPTSGFSIAIMQGGVSDGKHSPGLLSLGRINHQIFWLFYRATETFDNLTQLKGKRIAVGPAGSATKMVAEKVLGVAGITSETATLLSLGAQSAVDALNDGRVDVIWIAYAPEAPIIGSLLRDPKLRLMNFAGAEAFTRIFPFLVLLVMPQGVIDYERKLPPADVTVIATTNAVLVRDDIHPALIGLLVGTMLEAHSESGLFHKVGDFPTQIDPEYPMASSAVDFYKNGPSFLNKYLPYWIVPHVLRLLAALLAGGAVIYPLFNLAPKLYRWLLQDRMRRLYRRLRIVEEAAQTELTAPQVVSLQTELEDIDLAARILPQRHSDLFFILEHHITLTRTQLASRLVEMRHQIAKVV